MKVDQGDGCRSKGSAGITYPVLLIHTHAVELVRPVSSNLLLTLIHGATQRAAAEVIAGLWVDQEDTERTSYTYWYWEYAGKFQSRTFIPPEKVEHVERLRRKLESDQRVKSIFLDKL
jgi:hypothetical protein